MPTFKLKADYPGSGYVMGKPFKGDESYRTWPHLFEEVPEPKEKTLADVIEEMLLRYYKNRIESISSTDVYSKVDPEFLKECVTAIEEFFAKERVEK